MIFLKLEPLSRRDVLIEGIGIRPSRELYGNHHGFLVGLLLGFMLGLGLGLECEVSETAGTLDSK